MKIALHYTSDDIEKAKQMISGSYRDLFVIKGTFTSSSLYGAFLLFLHQTWGRLLNLYVIATQSYSIEMIDCSADWKLFEKDMSEEFAKGTHDNVLSHTLQDEFDKKICFTFAKNFTELLKTDDSIKINHLFQRLIQDTLSLQRVDVNIEYQPISSLDMETHSTSIKKIDLESISKDDKNKDEKSDDIEVEDSDVEPEAGKDKIDLILNCSLILSPIKGKHISNIQAGDRIMISITDKSPKAVSVAKAMNACDEEGNLKPVSARIKTVKYIPNEGYKFYALIAKGILAKIIEEEDNIKISMDPVYDSSTQETDEKTKSNVLKIVILLITFISFAIIAFFLAY